MTQEEVETIKIRANRNVRMTRIISFASVALLLIAAVWGIICKISGVVSEIAKIKDVSLPSFSWPQVTFVIAIALCGTAIIIAIVQALFKWLTDN